LLPLLEPYLNLEEGFMEGLTEEEILHIRPPTNLGLDAWKLAFAKELLEKDHAKRSKGLQPRGWLCESRPGKRYHHCIAMNRQESDAETEVTPLYPLSVIEALRAIEALNAAPITLGASSERVDSTEFAKWYWKACESSQPNDWMQAALAAQRVLKTKPGGPV
jgi:hypothetical protein